MFLCETKNQPLYVKETLRKCGYNKAFCIDPRGMAGGLAMGWKEEIKLTMNDHDDFFIYIEVEDQEKELIWDVIVFHCISTTSI